MTPALPTLARTGTGACEPPPRVLLLEDDVLHQSFLHGVLASAGFGVVFTATVADAREAVAAQDFALAIVDLGLPDGTGFDLVPLIRRQRPSVGIVIVTARDGEADLLEGLGSGADHYLTKPVNPRELLLRLHNLLVRSQVGRESGRPSRGQPRTYRFADWRFDPETRTLCRAGGYDTLLTSSEARILEVMIGQAGHPLTRRDLLNAIGRGGDSSPRAVDWLILRLRRKLNDDARDPRILQSVRGIGYRFYGPLEGKP